MSLKKLIDRVFVFLYIYEEQNEEEDRVIDKVIGVTDDILSLAYAYKYSMSNEEYKRLVGCANAVKYLVDKPFYSNDKSLVRKVVLDTTGDIGRLRDKLGVE